MITILVAAQEEKKKEKRSSDIVTTNERCARIRLREGAFLHGIKMKLDYPG